MPDKIIEKFNEIIKEEIRQNIKSLSDIDIENLLLKYLPYIDKTNEEYEIGIERNDFLLNIGYYVNNEY